MIMNSPGRAGLRAADRWGVPAVTLALWGLVAWSGAYWGLKIVASTASALPVAPVRGQPQPVDPVAVGRLLGASPAAANPAAPSVASRFVLMGVVAGVSGAGAALIAVDGQPPRPYTVGATVTEGFLLQSVQGRRATLGPRLDAPSVVTLELPPLPG